MHEFLRHNRDELIRRCKGKVAQRPWRAATPDQLRNGVPLFLEQLTKTLQAEAEGHPGASLRISGASGGGASAQSEMGVTATAHGKQLLGLGYTVDQVVHDYGDLCQAITDLAVERDAPFSVDEFRTLNRCLDNAIAEAVTEFSAQRDMSVSQRHSAEVNERIGFLVHELRNSLQTAALALAALEAGQLPIAGATGRVLNRSLVALTSLVNHALDEVRPAAKPSGIEVFPLAAFIADAGNAALLQASARGCRLTVKNVDAQLEIEGRRDLLLGALVNLLQNAFKFTRAQTEVVLNAYADATGRVFIDVEDHCGGLAPGAAATMFGPFTRQQHDDKSGLGLGLSIARANVEASGGTLAVRDVPGTGCVFTIALPAHRPAPVTS